MKNSITLKILIYFIRNQDLDGTLKEELTVRIKNTRDTNNKYKNSTSNKYMLKIILDTNILMAPGKFGVGIFSQLDKLLDEKYKVYTLDKVIKELENLSKKRDKEGKAARLGLQLIKEEKIKEIRTKEKNTDESLLQESEKENRIIATNDKELIKKLKEGHRKVIRLRQKKYLIQV